MSSFQSKMQFLIQQHGRWWRDVDNADADGEDEEEEDDVWS